MSLLELITAPEDVAKDRDYYDVQESHLEYLRKHRTTKVEVIGREITAKYKGDFYGLLNYLGVDKKYHYLIMRLNNLSCSSSFDGDTNIIVRPDLGTINGIFVIYSSEET